MKPANSVFASFGTTVFETMTRLAIEHQTINLGQGFPDEDGPNSIKAMVDQATQEGPNPWTTKQGPGLNTSGALLLPIQIRPFIPE